MNLSEYNTQNDVYFITEVLFIDVLEYRIESIFRDVFREFGLKKEQFQSVNIEYNNYGTGFPVSEFRNIAYGLFFYEIATDVVKDNNYLEKMKKILIDNFPSFAVQDYTPDEKEERVIIFWNLYHYLCRDKTFDIEIEKGKSLKRELEELLEVPDLDDEVMYKKYEKKQISNYLAHFGLEGDLNTLAERFGRTVCIKLGWHDNNFNTQMFRFGYIRPKDVKLKEAEQVLKETILIEIKAFLKERIRRTIDIDGITLGKNQIMRLASIEDFETFHQRVLRSCNEYFYAKEIANAERLWVYENIFNRNADTTEKLEVEGKEVAKEQPIKESNEEIEKLQQQLEQLKKENEDLKKKLNNKEKEFLSDLRNIREENDRKFNLQQEKIKEMLRQNIGWALMFQVITLEEHEDDLLYPYKLEALQNKRVLVLGGRDEVRREFAKVIPQAVFIENETQKIPTGKIDCIFIFNRYFSHKIFYKYIRFARKNDIPVGYTPSTNMERILSDLFQAVKRINELEIPEFILD